MRRTSERKKIILGTIKGKIKNCGSAMRGKRRENATHAFVASRRKIFIKKPKPKNALLLRHIIKPHALHKRLRALVIIWNHNPQMIPWKCIWDSIRDNTRLLISNNRGRMAINRANLAGNRIAGKPKLRGY